MIRQLNDLKVPFSSTNLFFYRNSLNSYPCKVKTSRFHPYQIIYKTATLIHLTVLFILGNKTSLPENNWQANECLYRPVSWVVSWKFMKFICAKYIRARHTQIRQCHNRIERVFIYKEVWNRSTKQNKCVLIPLPNTWERILSRPHTQVKKKKVGSQNQTQ